MARFLLIHGSCHGAWCWRDLLGELANLGHDAHAIDLPAIIRKNLRTRERGWTDAQLVMAVVSHPQCREMPLEGLDDHPESLAQVGRVVGDRLDSVGPEQAEPRRHRDLRRV